MYNTPSDTHAHLNPLFCPYQHDYRKELQLCASKRSSAMSDTKRIHIQSDEPCQRKLTGGRAADRNCQEHPAGLFVQHTKTLFSVCICVCERQSMWNPACIYMHAKCQRRCTQTAGLGSADYMPACVCARVCTLCAHLSLISSSPFVQRRLQAETQWWGGWLRQTVNFREGETGHRCHGDDLLSATASHSSRLWSNWLWNEGGREVEEGRLVKRRVNELSLLSESGPLINRPCSPSLMFACVPRERLIFSPEQPGRAYRRTATRLNSLICGLGAASLCFQVSTWLKQLSCLWNWSGAGNKVVALSFTTCWKQNVAQLRIKMTR